MARTDDFQQARDLAAKALALESLEIIAQRSGFVISAPKTLRVVFLDRVFLVTAPAFSFVDEADHTAPIPLQEQVLVLHYLQGARPVLENKWIAYREIPGAAFYFGPFMKRAIEPLKKIFGNNIKGFAKAAEKLGATAVQNGSCAYRLDVFPYVPLQIVLWEGDEEFPTEAVILFDASVKDRLSPEDAAWLASLPVYRMMSLSR